MILGLNTDVRHAGKTFHIQTEDSGPAHPVLITHLFVGGTIIASAEQNYRELLEGPEPLDEEAVRARMKAQHRAMYEALTAGKYDDAVLAPRSLPSRFKDIPLARPRKKNRPKGARSSAPPDATMPSPPAQPLELPIQSVEPAQPQPAAPASAQPQPVAPASAQPQPAASASAMPALPTLPQPATASAPAMPALPTLPQPTAAVPPPGLPQPTAAVPPPGLPQPTAAVPPPGLPAEAPQAPWDPSATAPHTRPPSAQPGPATPRPLPIAREKVASPRLVGVLPRSSRSMRVIDLSFEIHPPAQRPSPAGRAAFGPMPQLTPITQGRRLDAVRLSYLLDERD